jgi:hypothetical protein
MLTPEQYKLLTDQISAIYNAEYTIKIELGSGATLLNGVSEFVSLINADVSFYTAEYYVVANMEKDSSPINNMNKELYEIEAQHVLYDNRSLTDLVLALQSHIINNYGDVNTFLSENNEKVTSEFASLSSRVGIPIDSSNIGD